MEKIGPMGIDCADNVTSCCRFLNSTNIPPAFLGIILCVKIVENLLLSSSIILFQNKNFYSTDFRVYKRKYSGYKSSGKRT
jgi:hypothetical protein